jgi:mono/diheme cytochrome c family protein
LTVTAAVLVVGFSAGTRLVYAQDPAKRTVWDGVFTEAQAERGVTTYGISCARCHGANLEGNNAKPLTGEMFWRDFQARRVEYLLSYMSKNMPNDAPGTLSPTTYVELTALILSKNQFPAGSADLTPASAQGIEIVPKDGPTELPDKTFARVVGCLAKGGNGWVINNGIAPERVEGNTIPPGDATRALGDRSYPLLFVLTRLDKQIGHRVAVRGALMGEGGRGGINVTDVASIAPTCP